MTADPTAARLASIRARADAATPGPWEVRDCSPAHPELSALFADESVHGSNFDMLTNWSPGFATNAAFIAAARTDIPFLLDQLAAAEAKIAQVQTLAEDFISAHDGDQGWDLKALNYLHREGQAILSASPVSALDAARADALHTRTGWGALEWIESQPDLLTLLDDMVDGLPNIMRVGLKSRIRTALGVDQ